MELTPNHLEEERKEIIFRYRQLLTISSPFLTKKDLDKIRKATEIVLEIYKEERDSHQQPFVYYPLELARIISEEVGLATTSIISSLLYQPVKQGKLELKQVKTLFGEQVASIIQDVIKITEASTSNQSLQSDNLRKFILSLAGDVRVLMIQLAIRLYKLRNIHLYPEPTRERIALEATYLFSPLAHRLGLYNIKGELDDLAMRVNQPEMYESIAKKLEETEILRSEFVGKFVKPITDSLDKNRFKYEIKWRTKKVHSIYRKMKAQNVEFEEVMDTFAIRLILESKPKNEKADCWRVYSLITDLYPPNVKRMRDWISIPKSSGYESLHTTVMSPIGRWVEIQIRTRRMDEIAEKGFAAHWKYKGQKSEEDLDKLLNGFRDVLEDSTLSAQDVLDNFKMNAYSDEVFVFTPKGDLIKLPKGATVLDFAFEIHSEVGAHCIGAKVNNRVVTLRQELKNGDQIELNLSKIQKPKQDWLSFVVTTKAKTKIKKELDNERIRIAEAGNEILKRKFRNWKIGFNDLLINKIIKHYKFKTAIDLYYNVATEVLDPIDIKAYLQQEQTVEKEVEVDKTTEFENKPGEPIKGQEPILFDDKNITGLRYRFAKCCKPLEGDSIVGFVTLSGEISIHRKDCTNAISMTTRLGYREIKVMWRSAREVVHANLLLVGQDRPGLVGDLSSVIGRDTNVSLRSISMDAKGREFEGTIRLMANSRVTLDALIQRLLKVDGVRKVTPLE